MSTPVVTFFNNKGGVGKTSLVYHLSWMFSDLAMRVLAVDLDPQANLSSAFLTEDDFESVFNRDTSAPPATIHEALRRLIEGYGDDGPPEPSVRVYDDPHCLAMLKNYRSLMPLAQEARKPMFHLKTADGAVGSHATAALEVFKDYKQLAEHIAARCSIALPTGAWRESQNA